jgi:hypothetical protein
MSSSRRPVATTSWSRRLSWLTKARPSPRVAPVTRIRDIRCSLRRSCQAATATARGVIPGRYPVVPPRHLPVYRRSTPDRGSPSPGRLSHSPSAPHPGRRDAGPHSQVTTGGTVARKRAALRPSNVNRVLNDRLWDTDGALWTRTAGEPSHARILQLLTDAAVPVGMHCYDEPLRWLHRRSRNGCGVPRSNPAWSATPSPTPSRCAVGGAWRSSRRPNIATRTANRCCCSSRSVTHTPGKHQPPRPDSKPAPARPGWVGRRTRHRGVAGWPPDHRSWVMALSLLIGELGVGRVDDRRSWPCQRAERQRHASGCSSPARAGLQNLGCWVNCDPLSGRLRDHYWPGSGRDSKITTAVSDDLRAA